MYGGVWRSVYILYHKSVFSTTGQYSLSQVSILYHRSVFSITGQYSLPQFSILYHSSVFSEYAEYGIALGQYSLSQTESLMSLY